MMYHKENMNNVKGNSILQNISSTVPIILLILSIGIGYANLKSELSLIKANQDNTKVNIKALDDYDRFLQRQTEGVERRLLVAETKQKEIRDTQVSLEVKLDRILRELTSLGTSITELKTINQQNKD